MAFDGNGNWIPEFSAKEDRDAGVKILASHFDDVFQQDLKESFEKCLTNDGQSRPLQDFNFNNHKGINVADPETDSDVVNVRSMTKAVKELEDMLEEKKANVDGSNFTEETSKAVLEKLDEETKGGFVALGMPDYSRSISVSTGTSIQSVSVASELRVFFTNKNEESSFSRIFVSLCDSSGTIIKSGIICCRSGYEGAPSSSGVFLPSGSYFKVETWTGVNATLQLTPMKGV
jgi:hypothetical protein